MDLFTFIKPKNALEGEDADVKKPYVPDEMWEKCPECGTLLLTTDVEENYQVCSKCNHHFRLNARKRIEMTADKDSFVEMDAELESKRKRYLRHLQARRNRGCARQYEFGVYDGLYGYGHRRQDYARL